MNDYCTVATIGGTYGVNGWVKLTIRTESIEAFLEYEALFLQSHLPGSRRGRSGNKSKALNKGSTKAQPESWYPFCFEEIKAHGKGLIAKLPGCFTKEQAATFTGRQIGVRRDQLPELEAGEHYWDELIGLQVHSSAGHYFGVVDGLMETGANDVLIVKPVKASETGEASMDEQERLIPYLPGDVVLDIDRQVGKMLVEWDSDF